MNTVATKTRSALGIHGFVLKDTDKISTSKLTLNDRCDSCSAAAKVRAKKGDFELIFCAHHARKNAEALVAQNWLIDDQSE